MEQDIQRACKAGDLSLIQKAVETSPLSVNRVDAKLGWTPLYRTVICGHFEAARYLLAHGADANLSNEQQETPLHQAADNNQADIAEALLKADANPNVQQQEGETPLHLAARKGYLQVSEVLLKFRANPNLCNSELGRTPMHYAVEYGHRSLVDLLVAHGASLMIQDKRGKRPIDLAVSEDLKKALKSPRSPSPMQLPSPDPFDEIPSISSASFEKVNLSHDESPHLTPRNLTPQSDSRSIEDRLKEIEEIQVRIRSTVKQSYEAISNQPLPTEPDAERSSSATALYRTAKFGDSEKQGALRKWLRAIRLEEIADVLLDAGYDDMEQLTMQMQSSLPITLEMLEEIGVSLIGYRLRFLASLTEELKPSNPKQAKKNQLMSCIGQSQLGCSVSLPTLRSWLDGLGLLNLHSVLTRSGFDDLEQLLFLMNTAFPITDAELKEIGVCKPGHRIRILAKLREDSIGVTYTRRLEQSGSATMERSHEKAACELCLVM
jgi:hypothetical protein